MIVCFCESPVARFVEVEIGYAEECAPPLRRVRWCLIVLVSLPLAARAQPTWVDVREAERAFEEFSAPATASKIAPRARSLRAPTLGAGHGCGNSSCTQGKGSGASSGTRASTAVPHPADPHRRAGDGLCRARAGHRRGPRWPRRGAGERATIRPSAAPEVKPVTFWEDWTGGMADYAAAAGLAYAEPSGSEVV